MSTVHPATTPTSPRSETGLRIAVAVLALLLVASGGMLACILLLGRATPYPLSVGGGGGDAAESVVLEEGGKTTLDAAPGVGEIAREGAAVDNTVRYASLGIEVTDVTEAVARIRAAAEAAGGSIQSSDLYSGSGRAWPESDGAAAEPAKLTGGYVTVAVPDTELESFLTAVRDVGRVTSESTSGYDVTTQYEDFGARIPILEAERDTLTAMLARATTIEEELGIRDRLVSVSAELESLKRQLQVLQEQDRMATVSISLTVPASALPPSSVNVPWFSWYELQQAVAAGVAGFQRVVYAFITLLLATAPLWIPLVVVLWVLRRRRRAAAAAAGPAAPAEGAEAVAERTAGEERAVAAPPSE